MGPLPTPRKHYELERAERLAGALIDRLAGTYRRIEIAGSIRRRRPVVGDIELVAIPRWESRPDSAAPRDLFTGPPMRGYNLMHDRLTEISQEGRLVPIHPQHPTHHDGRWADKERGSLWTLLIVDEALKVDLFLTDPIRWGLTLLIRTGSARFSQAMLTHWKTMTGGGYSENTRLHDEAGNVQSCPEEADVFRTMGVPWIDPPQRTGAEAIAQAIEGQRAPPATARA